MNDDAMSVEKRLIDAVEAVAAAVEREDLMAGAAVGQEIRSDCGPRSGRAVAQNTESESPHRGFYASIAGLAALLVLGVLGIAVLIGRTGPSRSIQPGGSPMSTHNVSTVPGAPPATTVPPSGWIENSSTNYSSP